jgi:hypothetical protein
LHGWLYVTHPFWSYELTCHAIGDASLIHLLKSWKLQLFGCDYELPANFERNIAFFTELFEHFLSLKAVFSLQGTGSVIDSRVHDARVMA